MTSPYSVLQRPEIDPTPIFELFRGSYGSELLTAATAHFNVFGILARESLSLGQLCERLEIAERPVIVLTTALLAMGLIAKNEDGRLVPTPLAAAHLVPGAKFDVSNYVGLAASAPSVLDMVERLRTNTPAGLDDSDQGTAFIYRQGVRSAMEKEEPARHFTLALAGRAKNVAPALAEQVTACGPATLLDVGGGTGIYSIALLQKNPKLRAIVLDRPEVLKLAEEFAREYGVEDRLECREGDMFVDELPAADLVLLSNILHDWDVPECRALVARCAASLSVDGSLLIHDVFLNDELDGPLPIAMYSAALFTLTEGRAYSEAEYREWLEEAGLAVLGRIDTLVHCGVLIGKRRA
jgi:predicted O-methyltransferase YrrM